LFHLGQSRGRLAAVAQAGGNAVDGQMDAGDHATVGVARAVALEELDLDVIERIDVRKTVTDRIRQQGVMLEQRRLLQDCQ
jgi:hypothetical protein